MSSCKSRPTGIFTTTTRCVFTISPRDSSGHRHFHEEKAFGRNSAYTDAIAVKGRLSVVRGAARLEMVDEARTTRSMTAAAGAPAPVELRMKTVWRYSARGLEFTLMPVGATHSADVARPAPSFAGIDNV